jgi:hypothetical protein
MVHQNQVLNSYLVSIDSLVPLMVVRFVPQDKLNRSSLSEKQKSKKKETFNPVAYSLSVFPGAYYNHACYPPRLLRMLKDSSSIDLKSFLPLA